MKLRKPEPDDLSEMAGRMYEACDLQRAIEGGKLKTVDEILVWVKKSSANLQALMKLPTWVINNCCVDIPASIEHGRLAGLDAQDIGVKPEVI